MSTADTVQNSVAIAENERSEVSFLDGALNTFSRGLGAFSDFKLREAELKYLTQQQYTAGATVSVERQGDPTAGRGFLASTKPEYLALGGVAIVVLVVLLLKVK